MIAIMSSSTLNALKAIRMHARTFPQKLLRRRKRRETAYSVAKAIITPYFM